MSKGLLFSVYFVSVLSVIGSNNAYAADGDVTYGAPYLWVNPETGELETINPGPQLKTHAYGLDEDSSYGRNPSVAGVTPASKTIADANEGISAGDTGSSRLGVIIAGVVMLLIAVGVFLRRNIKASSSTISTNQ
jgi:hypothetical protein